MRTGFFVYLIFLLLIVSLVYAAPAPLGIAINPDTKECGGYWPGDEYVAYELPEGWKSYFPDGNGVVITEYGSCGFERDIGAASSGEEERCCAQLNLRFAGKDIGTSGVFSSPYLNVLGIGIMLIIVIALIIVAAVLLIVWLLLRKKKKNRKR